MSTFVFLILLILATFFESTGIRFPFVLLILFFAYLFLKSGWIFFAGVLCGIVLDIMTLQSIGGRSLFFLLFLFLITLYENKYEVKTVPFIIAATFLGSSVYSLILGFGLDVRQAIMIGLFAGFVGFLFQRMLREERKYPDFLLEE